MVFNIAGLLRKLGAFFARFPHEAGVRPDSFDGLSEARLSHSASGLLTAQSVTDKFYFLLFGALSQQLKARGVARSELIVVRSVNGAIGAGPLAEMKRSGLVAWLVMRPWIRAYVRVFDAVAYRCATWQHPVADLLDYVESRRIWLNFQGQARMEQPSLKINDIEVADLVICSYLRFKPQAQFDFHDPFVRRLIWQALRDARQAEAYFDAKKPSWYLTSYTTYLEHGIPTRVALKHGVKVWSFGNLNRFGKCLSISDPYQTLDYSDFRTTFEALSEQASRLEDARVLLERRLSGCIDAATSYMRQSAYGNDTVPLPSNLNGSVVIFLHDFYDSPHVYPDLIFNDFWQWICFTIDGLRSASATFFLKPHPNQISLSDEALGELCKTYPGLQLLPATASNVQLAQAGIVCGITAYGTVAHELAYLGIPSICCARHPHHSFGFSRTATTRAEYRAKLAAYRENTLSVDELKRQALMFYYMHNLYGDDDAVALRTAFVNFWRSCNNSDTLVPNEESTRTILQDFEYLARLPAFGRFVDGMVANALQ
ncbi:MAG: hypothetical protein RL392_267 [Pseudomonadota bacterium]|jgi:hypothetical protein